MDGAQTKRRYSSWRMAATAAAAREKSLITVEKMKTPEWIHEIIKFYVYFFLFTVGQGDGHEGDATHQRKCTLKVIGGSLFLLVPNRFAKHKDHWGALNPRLNY